jgi:alpha-1,6-mannosyltransferase
MSLKLLLKPRLVFIAIAISLATLWAGRASSGDIAQQLIATAVVAIVGFSLCLWCLRDQSLDETPVFVIFALLFLTRGIALFSQPLLEDDHFRYLWDGFITATTARPYAYPPSHYFTDPSVPAIMLDVINGINHPELPTIYGPLLQMLFALSYWLAPGELWPFKCFLLLAETLAIALLSAQRVPTRWLLVIMLHPLVLKESAISAHPDILIGAILLAATIAWKNSNESAAAALAAIAVAAKMSAIVALPFFLVTQRGQLSWRALFVVTLTLLACYVPVVSGRGELSAIGVFGAQWTFNPLLFKAFTFMIDDTAARIVTAAAFSLSWFFVSVCWLIALRRSSAKHITNLPPIVMAVFLLLIFSPVVNPWYWLWVLPLAIWQAHAGSITARVTLVAASVSLLAYSHFTIQWLANSSITTFAVPLWASLIQGVVIAASALIFMRHLYHRETAHGNNTRH